jgi:hypothetical protein
MVGVVIGRSPRAGHLQTAGVCGDGAPRFVDRIKEALGIRSGVMDARDDRKALKPLPHEAFADRGLTRADLPDGAVQRLTER